MDCEYKIFKFLNFYAIYATIDAADILLNYHIKFV